MKWIYVVIIFAIIFNLQIVSAESYNLDITAELIDGNGQVISNINEIPLNQNLGLYLQIVNTNDFWVNPNSLQLRIETTKNGERFYPLISFILKDEILLNDIYVPPNSKKDIYVILENYNSLDENERSGSWEIHFDLYAVGINSFYSSNLNSINSITIETIKPNNIIFEARNEIPDLDTKYNIPSVPYIADKITPLNTIIGFIIAVLSLVGMIIKFKKS